MGYSIEIKPLATMDIIDAYNWYELQKEGLGLAFLSALDKILQSFAGQSLHAFLLP